MNYIVILVIFVAVLGLGWLLLSARRATPGGKHRQETPGPLSAQGDSPVASPPHHGGPISHGPSAVHETASHHGSPGSQGPSAHGGPDGSSGDSGGD